MFFSKGDWFEISGGTPFQVVYADEDVFVSRATRYSPVIGLILTNDLRMHSNNLADNEGKYWIRKIPCPETYQQSTAPALCGGQPELRQSRTVVPKQLKTPEEETQGLTEKELYCAAKHLKAYFDQCCDEEIADWGKPCTYCPQFNDCKFAHIDHVLSKISDLTGVPIHRHRRKH